MFLSPSPKYEIYVRLMPVGGHGGSGRGRGRGGAAPTIVRLRQVARQGALDALSASGCGLVGQVGS